MATEISSTSVSTETIKVASPYVPETPTSTGAEGQLAWDENFFYICVAENLWARTNVSIQW